LTKENTDEISLNELLKMKLSNFTDVGEFILALDTLFVLGKIEISDNGIIRYVS
jgi:hypothetical protein